MSIIEKVADANGGYAIENTAALHLMAPDGAYLTLIPPMLRRGKSLP